MNIVKTVITVTVLHDGDYPINGLDLEDIAELINYGPAVGLKSLTSSEPVPPDQVAAELQALGNDGTFFDEESDDDEA